MSRWTHIISEATREKVVAWVRKAPVGMRVTFMEAKRTDAQNRLMWPLLTALSEQLVWHDQKYTPDDWKDFVMHQLGNGRWMPAEEGGMVPIGMRTSQLSVAEMGDLIEVIYAFGARSGVSFEATDTAPMVGTVAGSAGFPEAAQPVPQTTSVAA